VVLVFAGCCMSCLLFTPTNPKEMQQMMLSVLLVTVFVASGVQDVTAVTPLNKVIEMLAGLGEKGKALKQAEMVEFAKFHEWATHTRTSKEKSIEEGTATIARLEADIDKANADAEQLAGEIAELEQVIAAEAKELKDATAVRAEEKKTYDAQHFDYSESIDAVERAIAVLKARPEKIPQSLAQVQALTLVPAETKAAIESFLALANDAEGPPEALAYEGHSKGVIGMLEKLNDKFRDQRLALEKAEINTKSNFEVLAQKLTDNDAFNKKVAGERRAARAGRLQDAATASADLTATKKTKEADEKVLADTNSLALAESIQFEKNQVIRFEELEAMKKAVEILSSDDVSGAADTHLPAAAASALAQLRSKMIKSNEEVRQRVAALLQKKAASLNSRYLSLLVSHVSDDPFAKVKKMIHDMIIKLQEEANAEADEHAFCTSEMAMNKQVREDKTAEVDKLTTKSDKLNAEIARLSSEITSLNDALSGLRAQQAEATENRNTEKANNAQTIKDAKGAQVAVERAIEILRDFYDKAKGADFMQEDKLEPYKGMQASSGGILGMLDVVLSDFTRLETETTATDQEQARDHETFMNESNEDIAVKETTVKHNGERRAQAEESLRATTKELELTQEELSAASEYNEKLKARCVDTGLSYEDRKATREEEIASLREALSILNQQDVA